MTESERLAALEDAAARLWPYVRHFGLCGASLEAQQAVADLGALLGKDTGHAAVRDAANEARRRVFDELLAWFPESRQFRLMTKAGREQMLEEFRQMRDA